MAITLQRSGAGTLAYPFYLCDFDQDRVTNPPTPADSDAVLFVLETKQTYVWRNGTWQLFDDRQSPSSSALAQIRQAVDQTQNRLALLTLRELRNITLLLAQQQGIAASQYEPLPEVTDVLPPT